MVQQNGKRLRIRANSNFLHPFAGPFIQQATISVQGGKEKFYLHLPTAHLDQQGIADYLAGELQETEVEVQEEIEEEEEEKIPYFVKWVLFFVCVMRCKINWKEIIMVGISLILI